MTTYPVYWHPMVEITQMGRLGMEGRVSRKLVLGSHTGTHIDAPSHFIEGGATIDKLPLETFIGKATVVDFSHASHLEEINAEKLEARLGNCSTDRIIIRFDWSDNWGNSIYYKKHPFFSECAARWVAQKNVKLLGLDTPQADDPRNGHGCDKDSPVHKILLGAGVIKLEYLTNLRLLSSSLVDIIALPMNILDGDGSPVRCVAIEDKE